MKRIGFAVLFLLWASWSGAATYYVDNCDVTGNDSNNGTATSTPWLTIAKVNASSFSAGDSVLFNRGCIWREQLAVLSSGSSSSPITIGAYGTGVAPRIYGSSVLSSWTEATTTNLLSYSSEINSWNAVASSISTNVVTITDPQGGTLSDGIIGSAIDGTHGVYNSIVSDASSDYAFSVFLRPGNREWVYFVAIYKDAGLSDIGAAYAYYNVATGTIGGHDGTTSRFNLRGKNGFRNIGFVASTVAGTAYAQMYIIVADSDGDSIVTGDASTVNLYAFGAQITKASSAAHIGSAYYAGSVSTEPKTVYQDGNHLMRCTAISQLIYGSFYWDDAADRLYVKTSTLADPSGFTIEAGQRDYGIVAQNLDYAEFHDLDVRYTNSSTILVLNTVGTHSGVVLDGVTVVGGEGILSSYPDDIHILNCDVSQTASLQADYIAGITISNGSATITDTEIHDGFGNGFIGLGSGTKTATRLTTRRMGDGTYLGRSGIGLINTGTLNCYNCTAEYNEEDGFSVNNTATLNCIGCNANNNGNALPSATNYSGDGYTAHIDATLNVSYSLGYNNFKSGIAVTDATGGTIYNSVFYNNYETSIDTGSTPWLKNQGIGIDATGDWIVKNNITSNNGTEINITATGAGAGTKTIDYNLYYDGRGGSAFHYNGTDYNFANYKTASSQDANSLNSDPLFISTTDFHLQAGSPAINAGANVNLTTDYDGNGVRATPSIGAYEMSTPIGTGSGAITLGTGGSLTIR